MEELIITGVCAAIALAFWLLLVTDRKAKPLPPPDRRPFHESGQVTVITLTATDREKLLAERRRVRQAMRVALAERDGFQCRCIDDGTGRGGVVILLLLALLCFAFAPGCGAREHRDNLGEVVKLQQTLAEKEAAEEKRKKEALAEIALEQRTARKEVQDAKRTINQTISEMEGD